ncbi:hypothetical protein [Blastococcus montanus]|uniref:hypothetical protein n=1 Tax=Blastococcus montanus TaxID=3144973 RepID=UPI00320A6AD0
MLVLLSALMGAAIAGAVAVALPSTYESEAVLLWRPDAGLGAVGVQSQSSSGDLNRELNTQTEVVQGDAVVAAAARTTSVDATALRRAIDVATESDANLLSLRVSGPSAEAARDRVIAVTNAYVEHQRDRGRQNLSAQADALVASIEALNQQLAALEGADNVTESRRAALLSQLAPLALQEEQLRAAAAAYAGPVEVLSEASLPTDASGIGVPVGLSLGAILGLALGSLLAMLKDGWTAVRQRPEAPAMSQPHKASSSSASNTAPGR